MTERQKRAIERARVTPARFVEIAPKKALRRHVWTEDQGATSYEELMEREQEARARTFNNPTF